jgi:hypothetical protein
MYSLREIFPLLRTFAYKWAYAVHSGTISDLEVILMLQVGKCPNLLRE